MLAGNQRHGRRGDFLRRLRGSHEGDVYREGHQRHPAQQDEVGQDVQPGTTFYHGC
ncbi:Uncharacterised protein [Bordetella pertussis]|nr:Uncharacterised protein [Bordetella pertussis]